LLHFPESDDDERPVFPPVCANDPAIVCEAACLGKQSEVTGILWGNMDVVDVRDAYVDNDNGAYYTCRQYELLERAYAERRRIILAAKHGIRLVNY